MSKLISVYGSPASGKTTLSIIISRILAAQKRSTVLLSTNRTVPMLKVLAPAQVVDKTYSVGNLFLSSSFTQEDVCRRILFTPGNSNLGFMGMAPGDTPNTYSGIMLREKILELYSILGGLADYIIVDCMSNVSPNNDPLGNAALAASDLIIETLTADIMGVEYRNAILPVVDDTKSSRKHITAFSNVTTQHPIKEIRRLAPEATYLLPRSEEVLEFYLSGSFKNPQTYDGRCYVQQVSEILKEGII